MKELGDWVKEDGYDAIVVGSGYGGSVASCRLSMAGISVCLLEKGRKWESRDFPTDSLSILSTVRAENKNLGISFGKKDSLFQVHVQDNCLAVVACGLGGGSLVNAGVMVPTPPRAKRDPKWTKEWTRDWEICEAYASEMLRVQSVPHKFSNSKIMEQVLVSGDDFENSVDGQVKLTMNFDIEEQGNKSMKSENMGSCLACGNCLAGCPYNAKNSTDKTYLVSALQAGCTIKTECQVQYIVENPIYLYRNDEIHGKERRIRRWLVFLNEIDYIAADFVILSAGVFGTSEILFRSQSRGLILSERLGSGFSCNGNNVAYLAGSPTPLNAYGLNAKDFSKVPFHQRPGPSISSSYTSSLGITIQSAVLPTAYPYLLFKGITTYGWPNSSWFLHGFIDKLKSMLKLKGSNAMILNTMGYDDSSGVLKFDKEMNGIRFYPPHDSLLPRKVKAFQKISKKLEGTLFMSRYRSTSVHLLGGCNSSLDHLHGVCNPYGQVFDKKSDISIHQGLYVCDASLIPCSIGINPILTIATLAEHVSRHLVKDIVEYKGKQGTICMDTFSDQNRGFVNSVEMPKSVVSFKETMRGYIDGMPCEAYLKLEMDSSDWRKPYPKNKLSRVNDHAPLKGKVGGYVIFRALEVDKLHIINGEVDLCEVDERTPYTQYMHYRLLLAASSGSRYILEGKKTMNPYLLALYAWSETTTMHANLSKICPNNSKEDIVQMKGNLTISMIELLKTLISLDGDMKGKFVYLLVWSFYRTYISQVPRESYDESDRLDLPSTHYPTSILHPIQTEDRFMISCRQWESRKLDKERKVNPVLLINGYSTESYWLPTESNDFVRTLLDDGHETWLLQPRLHHLNSSNNFTIHDIGKFDIPAVMNKIRSLHGQATKVHVVAHCVGGLAIHIALMGGYISATDIASLSCTNSSMFFDVTFSSKFKMWLPLIPMSMVILGRNTILPLFESSKVSLRQHLLKFVARIMPRHQRCDCDECEVFSGIFGNTFWHENISPALHIWLNKQSLPSLPMSAFPHLRRICNAGFIVNSRGENSYLAHPERMAVHTLYISGGRTLLVTPHTSFLANNYMRLHQPSFRHERVVVDGFGHSDLWLGVESSEKVFPHILKHIGLAEEDNKCVINGERNTNNEEALSCGDDLFGEKSSGVWSFMSPSITLWLFILLLVMVVYYCSWNPDGTSNFSIRGEIYHL